MGFQIVSVPGDTVFAPSDSTEGEIAIIRDMRQLISRIDEGLHERLKRVAKRHGRSVNSIVVESLTKTVDQLDVSETGREWKERMIAEGKVVVPPEPEGPTPTWAELDRLTKGWGTSVSEQLRRDRRRD